MKEESARAAAQFLYESISSQQSHTHIPKSHPYTYCTTIGLLLFLHIIFIHQWRTRLTKRNVAVSYRMIIEQKLYYKALVALFSHPPYKDDYHQVSESQLAANSSVTTIGLPPTTSSSSSSSSTTNTRRNTSRAIEYGHDNNISPPPQQTQSTSRARIHRITQSFINIRRTIHTIYSRIYITTIYPILYSGLPLLFYISHILWQCRALEEMYNLPNDRQTLQTSTSNTSTSTTTKDHPSLLQVLEAEETLFKHIFPNQYARMNQNDYHGHSSTSSVPTFHSPYSDDYQVYSYPRVLLALTITSLLLDLLVTHLVLHSSHLSTSSSSTTIRRQGMVITTNQSNSPSSLLHPTTTMTIQKKLSNQKRICTLVPTCTSILLLFSFHFPTIPISITPYISTITSILGRTSVLSYMITTKPIITIYISFFLLNTLSHPHSINIYPFQQVFYGMISGILWIIGTTRFLASAYWGNGIMGMIFFSCLLSYYVECNDVTIRSFWFPWIDYVNNIAYGVVGGGASAAGVGTNIRNYDGVDNDFMTNDYQDDEDHNSLLDVQVRDSFVTRRRTRRSTTS